MRLPAREFIEWRAFFNDYPFTYERDEHQAALIAFIVANTSVRTKRYVNLDNFLPEFLKERPSTKYWQKPLDVQKKEFAAFREKLRSVRPEAVKRKSL